MDVLICTVGGSVEPVVDAVEDRDWELVVFVCSRDDPASGKKGSYQTVDGGEGILETAAGDLEYEILKVTADDAEEVVRKISSKIRELQNQGAELVANYTGGTKTMSAALFHAALAEDAAIELVDGPRLDLDEIKSGTQSVRRLDTSDLEAGWAIDEADRAWGRYAYAEAAEILDGVDNPGGEIQRALVVSRAFAAWDAFDHGRAHGLLRNFGAFVPGEMLAQLAKLKKQEPEPNWEAFQIWDLRLKAGRHADTGRFDTALMLLYRTVEWIAQWALRKEHGIETDDVPSEIADRCPGLVNESRDETRYTLGQVNAWRLIDELGGLFSDAAGEIADRLVDLSELRNQSLYAHGFRPVDADDFNRFDDWFQSDLEPRFVERAFSERQPHEQLPDSLREFANIRAR